MQYRTRVVARVPRARCESCGVHQVAVPWAEARSHFTAEFEAFAIDCLLVMSVSDAARSLRLSWKEVDGKRGVVVYVADGRDKSAPWG